MREVIYEVRPVDGLWEVRIAGGDGQIELALSSDAAIRRARSLVQDGGGGRVLLLDEGGRVAREYIEGAASSS